jgi:hypothetical protein
MTQEAAAMRDLDIAKARALGREGLEVCEPFASVVAGWTIARQVATSLSQSSDAFGQCLAAALGSNILQKFGKLRFMMRKTLST